MDTLIYDAVCCVHACTRAAAPIRTRIYGSAVKRGCENLIRIGNASYGGFTAEVRVGGLIVRFVRLSTANGFV